MFKRQSHWSGIHKGRDKLCLYRGIRLHVIASVLSRYMQVSFFAEQIETQDLDGIVLCNTSSLGEQEVYRRMFLKLPTIKLLVRGGQGYKAP